MAKSDKADVHRIAVERAERAWSVEQVNIDEAYKDLRFRAGEDQWDQTVKKARQEAGRPTLTINRIPQFVRQVTGDVRQMKPTIRTYGVDDADDREIAEVFDGIIRHIQGRSDAEAAYFIGADSQTAAGIGHWRIVTEEGYKPGIQEIRIEPMRDGVSVLWDPDAVQPMFSDARWCFVPVDMTKAVFKERYPDASESNFDFGSNTHNQGYFAPGGDKIRIAEYWVKEGKGKETKVVRYLMTGSEIIEGPTEWAGSFIPIISVIGEEVSIGDRIVRYGLVRFLREPQMRYNYWVSAQTEIIALQPKAPWLGTTKNFADNAGLWSRANIENQPYLIYEPDPRNSGQPPQRQTPPVASSGFENGLQHAADDMKAVTGIYDAALGARSNETSGKAILARQREGDVGTFVYMDNFTRALKHTGRILVDLIPKIYDTPRVMRIFGDDGAVDEIQVTEALATVQAGQYDVAVDMGPSYSTKRAEARDSMISFLQAFPPAAPVMADLFAKSQEWPMADKIAERLKTLLPPQIAEMEKQEEGKRNGEQPPGMSGPPPEMIQEMQQQALAMAMQQVTGSVEMQGKQIELRTKEAQAVKAEADAMKAQIEAEKAAMPAPMPQAPMMAPDQPAMPADDGRIDALAGALAQTQQAVEALIDMLPDQQEEQLMAELAGMPASPDEFAVNAGG